jgi:hypothetical protein
MSHRFWIGKDTLSADAKKVSRGLYDSCMFIKSASKAQNSKEKNNKFMTKKESSIVWYKTSSEKHIFYI